MMITRILLFLSFILTLNAHAHEYLLYGAQKLDFSLNSNKLSVQGPVFSAKEKSLLKDSSVGTDILKVSSDLNFTQLQKHIKIICSSCILEKNAKAISFSNDPYFKFQWALNNQGTKLEEWISDIDTKVTQGLEGEDIQIKNTIENQSSEKNILVAIIDSGVDFNHPDLKEQIYTNKKECKAQTQYKSCLNTTNDQNTCHEKWANFDANDNGYPLDCHGWNISAKSNPKSDVEGSGKVFDNNGHGTHVAGIIAAKKNAIGITGVIQNVTILPVQVSASSQNSSNGESATDKIAKGLLYAIKSKAQIINLSLGWRFSQDSILMREMISLAHKNNILIVAAAGNDHHNGPTFPCSYEEVICVASHTVNGKLSSFSNFGAHVDLVAPGQRILSTWPTHKRSKGFTLDPDYEYLSGTSQAAPYASGVLARLLNSGLSPAAAKISLLAGARKIKNTSENNIRHGNIDYQKSKNIQTQKKSFLSPLTKSPSLIKWVEETKSFKIKLKNYGQVASSVVFKISHIAKETQKNVRFVINEFHFNQIQKDQIIELNIQFESEFNIDGDFLFNLAITSKDENKTFLIKGQAISLIAPESTRSDLTSLDIIGDSKLIKSSILRPFKNYTLASAIDFISIKEVNDRHFISLVKYNKQLNSYSVHGPIRLPFANPVIINLSRVDIDQDGKPEYVITLINIESRTKRDTKFLVLDDQFKLKKLAISPKNTFDNKDTVIPGSFLWLKYQGKMVPAWIGVGTRPLTERVAATPWSAAPPEFMSNHLYLMLASGLKTLPFIGANELPLHFLYQSTENRSKGQAALITSKGLGFFKQYSIYKYHKSLVKIDKIEMKRYFDLSSARPLPISGVLNSNHAFFSSQSTNGSQNVFSIEFSDKTNSIKVSHKKALAKDPSFPITRVLSFNAGQMLSQTRHHILQQDSGINVSKVLSNSDNKRIRHHILVNTQGLYLGENQTPGLPSELLTPWQGGKNLFKPASWRLFGVKGCSEIGFILEENQDKLVYVCAESKKILKLNSQAL